MALADLALISGKKAEAQATIRQVLERHPDLKIARNKPQKLNTNKRCESDNGVKPSLRRSF
jgi:TolA-binding protein